MRCNARSIRNPLKRAIWGPREDSYAIELVASLWGHFGHLYLSVLLVMPSYNREPLATEGTNPSLLPEKEWWDSALRCFLAGEVGGQRGNPKMQRIATHTFLVALNHVLKVCTGHGLEQYRTASTPLEPGVVLSDPNIDERRKTLGDAILTVAIDQCSVGWSAVICLMYALRLRVVPIFDPSHRCWNDVELAIGSSNLWDVILLVTLLLNLNYGPWEGAGWWRELQEAGTAYMKAVGDWWCPAFRHFLKSIARDRGEEHMLGDESWVQSVWAELCSVATNCKGPKVALCRWMQWLDSFRWLDPMWHSRTLVMLYWGLSLGHVTGSFETKVLKLQGLQTPAENHGHQTMKAVEATQKQVRDLGKNTLHVALLLHMEPTLQRRARIIVTVAAPIRAWFTQQAKTLNNSGAIRLWYCQQASGAGLDSLLDVFAVMRQPKLLNYMGFTTSLSQLPPNLGAEPDQHFVIRVEDLWLGRVAQFQFHLVRHRLRSLLHHLEGYPMQFAFCLQDDCACVIHVLGKMHACHRAFEVARRKASPDLIRRCSRSYMNIPLVQEFFVGHALDLFMEVKPQLRIQCETIFSLGTTEIVESAFQRARSVESRDQSSKTVSASRLWHTCVQREVLTKVHKFDEVSYKYCSIKRAKEVLPRTLDPDWKRPSATKPAVPLRAVKGTRNPTWTTYSPLSQAKQFADMAIFRNCLARPRDWDLTDCSWLCCLLSAGLLVRRRGEKTWWFSLGAIETDAALGWRAEAVDDAATHYLPVCQKSVTGDPPYRWLCCLDHKQWEVLPVHWTSTANSLATNAMNSAGNVAASSSSSEPTPAPGVGLPRFGGAARVLGPPVSLLRAAAETGFGDTSEAAVHQIACFEKVYPTSRVMLKSD